MKIRKGDKVLIITGKDRNKTGIVEAVFPRTNRAVVTGINLVKKSVKKSSKNPQGGFIDKFAPIHVSNLMLLDSSGKPTRVAYQTTKSGKVRLAKTNKEPIKAEKS